MHFVWNADLEAYLGPIKQKTFFRAVFSYILQFKLTYVFKHLEYFFFLSFGNDSLCDYFMTIFGIGNDQQSLLNLKA